MRRSVGIRPIPTWVRGLAFIEEGEVVLIESKSERYQAFTPEHSFRLLSALAQLVVVDFGGVEGSAEIAIGRNLIPAFVEEHGLLWHGPDSVGESEFREPLSAWSYAAGELQLSVVLWSKLRESIESNFAQPVREYLRSLRDAGVFRRMVLPDEDDKLLEFASIQLSERITRGMGGCAPTLLAPCSLIGEDGEKEGIAGEFVFGNNPDSLVSAANYELASLISRKEWFLDCEGCGRMFRPDHGHQRFCTPACNERYRKRLQRQRERGDRASS